MKAKIKKLSDPILKSHYHIGQEIEVISYNKGIYFDKEKEFCFTADELELKDEIVQRVLNRFSLRSKAGIDKYGTTLQRTDLTTLEWINHAQEEAMDFILYLERLKDEQLVINKNK